MEGHTTAFELEAFMAKPQAAQLVEIWLNTKETNGAVAEAHRELSTQGLEIQKARLTFSEHIEHHVTEEELVLLRAAGSFSQMLAERKTTFGQVSEMWKWFTFMRIIGTIAVILQPFEVAIFLWWLSQ